MLRIYRIQSEQLTTNVTKSVFFTFTEGNFILKQHQAFTGEVRSPNTYELFRIFYQIIDITRNKLLMSDLMFSVVYTGFLDLIEPIYFPQNTQIEVKFNTPITSVNPLFGILFLIGELEE